jgi:hypothetical protein
MRNLAQMLQQAQQLQQKMAEVQASLEATEIAGQSGGGLVAVTLNGKGEMLRLQLDPSLLSPPDARMLEDLIVAAHNEAKRRVERHAAEAMSKLTGGLQLPPGFKLPF